MRNLLFVVTVLCAPVWADIDVNKKCESNLTEPSDEQVLQARAVASLLPMANMRGYLEQLTGEKPLETGFNLDTRHTSAKRAISRMVIKNFAERMGYSVKVEDFSTGANLIVELPGLSLDNEVVEVTAHYDSVVTGADDNGSGVALMLGMMELFQKTRHERRIRFVFMDLEEQGMVGARHHASKIADNPQEKEKLIGALVVDTIGWAHPESSKFLGVLEIGEKWRSSGDFDARLNFARELLYPVLRGGGNDDLLVSPETDNAKPGTSDLGQYWNYGLPAVLWAAAYEPGFVNPGYHRKSDTIANMNWHFYRRMSEVAVQMVAYAARARLKDDNQVSEQGWQILREQEDRSQILATYTLPKAADRDVSLASSLRYESYGSSTMGFSDGYSDFDSKSDDRKPYGIDKPKPSAKKSKKGESYDRYPLYIERFIRHVEESSASNIYMFILPSRKAAGSSKAPAVMLNRGFVSDESVILDLTNDSDEVFELMQKKVRERDGKVFRVTALNNEDHELMNSDLWNVVRLKIVRAFLEPLEVDVPGEGRFRIEVVNEPTTGKTKAKTKAKVKKVKEPKEVKAKINRDDSIWREE